ncbi:SRPBCC domain-containing protein [Streptomyces sp. MMS24-I2-30]|uniref:SRPBCC domain-containing protein n=1 Tax=Streptomyces sp. MMS24-I2-30 TaxID=3351564 RepID=UPI003896C8E0
MAGSIEQGSSQTRGNKHILHFLVRLPRPMETVWPALTTPEGLARWLTAADVLEPRLGGAVTLRGLGTGRVSAWDVDRVAEYTLEGRGRIRFHLERGGPDRSVLRFTHEYRGDAAEEPRWRARFEHLIDILAAAPQRSGDLTNGRGR